MADRELIRYRSLVSDSERWRGFELRDDDVVISTAPKCGTTWTQVICLMLIHQRTELPAPVSVLSPWLDQLTRPRDEVVSELDRQRHRRVIKTHTPLDGIPIQPGVIYVSVGRDPRDVALSMDNHMANMDLDAFFAARDAAATVDQRASEPLPPPAPAARLLDENARFWQWVDNPTPVTESGSSLLRTLRHVETFWNARDLTEPDIALLHYDDLKADLQGQIRRLAAHLGIDVPDARWPAFTQAATFDSMRAAASKTVPNAGKGLWRDERQFFHRGTSGQWRTLLSEDDLRRYHGRVDALVPRALSEWLHRESLG